MKKGKNTLLIIVLVILVVFITGISSIYIDNSIANSITAVTAIIGAAAIWYQLNKDHDISKAEFIIGLNNSFHSNQNIDDIYTDLKEFRDGKIKTFSEDQGRRMGDYVMYFQIMNYLVEEKIVTIDMVNKIFANKFFIFVNNPFVQKYQLHYNSINAPIFRLYEKWYNHRASIGEEELYHEYSLLESMNERFSPKKGKKNQIVYNEKIVEGY